jgi:hypothetical protein
VIKITQNKYDQTIIFRACRKFPAFFENGHKGQIARTIVAGSYRSCQVDTLFIFIQNKLRHEHFYDLRKHYHEEFQHGI